MRVVTAGQMREMDRRSIESGAASGAVLMDRAGRGLAKSIRRICAWGQWSHPSIRMVAGKGNNGGDIYAAAYHLYRHYPDLEIVLVGDPEDLQGETRWHYERVRDHVVCEAMKSVEAWNDHVWYGGVDLLVEGLLGTGAKGAPRDPIASAIRAINRARNNGALVVAVDIPSGVHADTGCTAGDAVVADFTVTMGLPKVGMLQPEALSFVGALDVVDIGIPDEVVDAVLTGEPTTGRARENTDLEQCISAMDVRQWLPPRERLSHKGSYGKVLVIGGAPGYSGAVAMAARAVCRSGAGLVYVLTPEPVAGRVAQLVPEAMVFAGKHRKDGGLAADALENVREHVPDVDAVLVGPGMTDHADGLSIIEDACCMCDHAVVLDADALNVLAAANVGLPGRSRKNLVLTPHPGEAARLLGISVREVLADRAESMRRLSEKYQAVVVLKGAGTLVSDGTLCGMNLTGTPGMATGGSGDVLAGMIAALCPQVESPWEAASAGVYVHGVAGNMAALAQSEMGMTAMDVLDMVPKAFGDILGR